MKKILLLVVVLIFIAACTKVSVTGGAVVAQNQEADQKADELNITKDGPGYDTPSKVVGDLLDEIDIKPFGDVI